MQEYKYFNNTATLKLLSIVKCQLWSTTVTLLFSLYTSSSNMVDKEYNLFYVISELICTSSPHYAPSISNIGISLLRIECSGSIIRRIDMQIQVIIDLQLLLQDDTAPVQLHGCEVVPLRIDCKDMAVNVILKTRYCSCLRMKRVKPTSFPNCRAKVH